MREHIGNADPKKLDGTKNEMEEWEQELVELEGLIPQQLELERLKEETPALEAKIKAQEDALPELSAQADEVFSSRHGDDFKVLTRRVDHRQDRPPAQTGE